MNEGQNDHLVNRGEFHRLGWKHYDIPLGICSNCHHRVYSDEKHSIKSFIDITGNNDFSYLHDDECPKHRLEEVRIITVLKCRDCGVEERSYATNFLFLKTK